MFSENLSTNLDFCKYLKESNIHYVDYSGVIDLNEGLRRIAALVKYFNEHKKDGMPIKVLMDARDYVKFSPETHDKLAKISREELNGKFEIVLAVLNSEYETIISEKEAWFTSEKKAMDWLKFAMG